MRYHEILAIPRRHRKFVSFDVVVVDEPKYRAKRFTRLRLDADILAYQDTANDRAQVAACFEPRP